jgi:hypothetical protein
LPLALSLLSSRSFSVFGLGLSHTHCFSAQRSSNFLRHHARETDDHFLFTCQLVLLTKPHRPPTTVGRCLTGLTPTSLVLAESDAVDQRATQLRARHDNVDREDGAIYLEYCSEAGTRSCVGCICVYNEIEIARQANQLVVCPHAGTIAAVSGASARSHNVHCDFPAALSAASLTLTQQHCDTERGKQQS